MAYMNIFIVSLVILVFSSNALVWGSPIVNQPEKRADAVTELVGEVLQNTGKATFFTPENASEGGTKGSCGKSESSTSRAVAVSAEEYDPSMCGKEVLIRHADKETIAEIRDKCPKCKKGSLDLTKVVFEALGDLIIGVLDINWCFLESPDCVSKNGAGGNNGKSTKGQKPKKPNNDEKDDERT